MKHCLVVDDSRVIRKVARHIVETLHFEAQEAEDGVAALDACRVKMPDVILLDWHMPNMTGVEFLRSLRRQPNGNHPIVMLCTIENDVALITEAINAGADEYLLKPFNRESLEKKLVQAGLL